MLRKIAAILFIFLFAAYSFHQAAIVLDYYARTASFAKNCENKARPAMHCNGKCQMMKKLKEEEKKEQQNPSRKSEKNEEIAFAKTAPVLPPVSLECTLHLYSLSSDTSFPKGVYNDVFHPPACV